MSRQQSRLEKDATLGQCRSQCLGIDQLLHVGDLAKQGFGRALQAAGQRARGALQRLEQTFERSLALLLRAELLA